MSESKTGSGKRTATGRPGIRVTWGTEFERIFVLGAARIRGEKPLEMDPRPYRKTA